MKGILTQHCLAMSTVYWQYYWSNQILQPTTKWFVFWSHLNISILSKGFSLFNCMYEINRKSKLFV